MLALLKPIAWHMEPDRMAYGNRTAVEKQVTGWRASKPARLDDLRVESRVVALARAGIDTRMNGCMLRSVPHCRPEYQSVIHAGDEPCCKA